MLILSFCFSFLFFASVQPYIRNVRSNSAIVCWYGWVIFSLKIPPIRDRILHLQTLSTSYQLEHGRHVRRRRRRAYAPTSNTASHVNHEKINSWFSFSSSIWVWASAYNSWSVLQGNYQTSSQNDQISKARQKVTFLANRKQWLKTGLNVIPLGVFDWVIVVLPWALFLPFVSGW